MIELSIARTETIWATKETIMNYNPTYKINIDVPILS